MYTFLECHQIYNNKSKLIIFHNDFTRNLKKKKILSMPK